MKRKDKRGTWFKRFMVWFYGKRATSQFIKEIMDINNLSVTTLVRRLEGLDQEKTYIATVTDVTAEELESLKKAYMMACNRMRWTAPQILFVNKGTAFIDAEDLKKFIEDQQKNMECENGKICV